MRKNYVVFLSPGTMFSESDTVEITEWNVEQAIEMAKGITQRHGAKPYCFYFITKGRTDQDLDSKIIVTGPRHFLGGKIETLEEIEARNDPREEILRSNMRCNGWKRVITNTNSYRITLPLEEDDVILSV